MMGSRDEKKGEEYEHQKNLCTHDIQVKMGYLSGEWYLWERGVLKEIHEFAVLRALRQK